MTTVTTFISLTLLYLSNSYSPTLGLYREAPNVAPNTYWIYSDNYLAGADISAYKDKVPPLRMWHVLNGEVVPEEVFTYGTRKIGLSNVISSEIEDPGRIFRDWLEYADRVLLAAINASNAGNEARENELLVTATEMWDGKGLRDRVYRVDGEYGTYKTALYYYLAADNEALQVLDKMQERDEKSNRYGGIYTEYNKDLRPFSHTDTNTETTSIVTRAVTKWNSGLPTVLGTVAGRVDLQGRADDSGALVQLFGYDRMYQDTTDSAGNYRIEAPPGVAYILMVFKPSYLYVQRTDVVVTAGVTITLPTISLWPCTGVPVTNAVSSIVDKLVIVWGWTGSAWQGYAPAYGLATLSWLESGHGYWINATQPAAIACGGNCTSLQAGWNLIGWPPPASITTAPVTDAVSSIASKLVVVWGWTGSSWQGYAPDYGLYTLSNLESGRGYWINVTENVTLTYGGNSYSLRAGWNLIGWLPSGPPGPPGPPPL